MPNLSNIDTVFENDNTNKSSLEPQPYQPTRRHFTRYEFGSKIVETVELSRGHRKFTTPRSSSAVSQRRAVDRDVIEVNPSGDHPIASDNSRVVGTENPISAPTRPSFTFRPRRPPVRIGPAGERVTESPSRLATFPTGSRPVIRAVDGYLHPVASTTARAVNRPRTSC